MAELERMLSAYTDLLAEVDSWFEKCSLASGDMIACKRGCSACCRGLFDITLLDACLLKSGFEKLSSEKQLLVLEQSNKRLAGISLKWPDFKHPYLLNIHPEDEWDDVMPDEDETPCVLLGDDGLCMVYQHRPMTCRLHGIPMVDVTGEVLFDEWCTLNFIDANPLRSEHLRFHFNEIFTQEQLLFREFTKNLFGKSFDELDTLIPTAVMIDFKNILLPEKIWSQSSF